MSTRQIKDAVNHSTGELVYFKSHAKATFMSDGKTVEEAINNIEIPTVPTKVSELENDSNFITIEDVPVLEIPEEYVTETELNDKGFLTEHQDISHLASKEWVNNKNYATEYELKTIDYSSINNTPTLEDETGELNIADENGNIGMKVSSEAIYANDFIAGEHLLSNKIDKIDVENKYATIEYVMGLYQELLNKINS